MSRVFAITAAANNVHINDKREGEATFTVTNVSGSGLRGRVNIVSTSVSDKSIFSIEGKSERDFSEEETIQFTVKIKIPSDIEKGTYNFSIDMVSVKNPDEDYTAGPSVSFDVSEMKSIVQPKKTCWERKWCLILSIVAAVTIVAGILVWAFSGSKVPDVAGKSIDEATSNIINSGYLVGKSEFEVSDKVAGIVINTKPAAGSNYESGETVILIVSKEEHVVPNIVGLSKRDAMRMLRKAGYHSKSITARSKSPAGIVFKTSPVAGAPLDRRSTVTIYISKRILAKLANGKFCRSNEHCKSNLCSANICKSARLSTHEFISRPLAPREIRVTP